MNPAERKLKVCYWGAYDPVYARNQVLISGLRQNGVAVIECQIPPQVRWSKQNIALFRQYLKIPHDFDAILVAATNQVVAPLAKLLSFFPGKPVIFDVFYSLYDSYVHDRKSVKEHSLKAGLFYGLDKMSLSLADLVIADTQQHSEYYHAAFGVPKAKLNVVYIGYDQALFVPEKDGLEKDQARFTLFFPGTFIPLHGIEYILKAAQIVATDPAIRFEFAGTGQTFTAMRALAEELQLQNCVFLGAVPLPNIPTLLARADVCLGIFGNTGKARRVIPNKVYEGLAMRKPVITGDSPAIREVFRDGEHLLLCPMADAGALASAILRLKQDAALRAGIAEKGYRLVAEQFTPAALGKQVKIIIETLL